MNVTAHPTAAWVIQQLREAFPFDATARFILLDRDSIFSSEVHNALRAIGVQPLRTAYHNPWQNGVAEGWIGTCQRELLDDARNRAPELGPKLARVCPRWVRCTNSWATT